MGEIYEVRDRQGRLAAMKVLSSDLQGRNALVGRMLDEACALRLIHHPNLVRWLDAGVLTNGRPFLVTELLRGRTLRAHLGLFGAVSPPRAQRWTTHLLLALDAIHGVDLVHCDVKLDNVFLCVDGTIKLLDLGAAERANSRHEGASLPPIGTPRYMAPEQLAGGDVDARTDVFAAGLLLAELLCGGWPFGDRPGSDPGTQVAAGHPRIARQARDLSAVVARAAAPEPDARYPSALAMARRVLSPPRRSVRAAPDCRSAVERLLVSDQ
jgi:serine/threonine protein kinase